MKQETICGSFFMVIASIVLETDHTHNKNRNYSKNNNANPTGKKNTKLSTEPFWFTKNCTLNIKKRVQRWKFNALNLMNFPLSVWERIHSAWNLNCDWRWSRRISWPHTHWILFTALENVDLNSDGDYGLCATRHMYRFIKPISGTNQNTFYVVWYVLICYVLSNIMVYDVANHMENMVHIYHLRRCSSFEYNRHQKKSLDRLFTVLFFCCPWVWWFLVEFDVADASMKTNGFWWLTAKKDMTCWLLYSMAIAWENGGVHLVWGDYLHFFRHSQ